MFSFYFSSEICSKCFIGSKNSYLHLRCLWCVGKCCSRSSTSTRGTKERSVRRATHSAASQEQAVWRTARVAASEQSAAPRSSSCARRAPATSKGRSRAALWKRRRRTSPSASSSIGFVPNNFWFPIQFWILFFQSHTFSQNFILTTWEFLNSEELYI